MDVKEAIAACIANPETFQELDPALFEAIVAELLAGFGWEVSLTPPARDGGYDILGLSTDSSGLQTSWLVECKRYRTGHKVGVEIARQLLGVKTHIGVPNALLVTSSSFTAGVREISSARHDLHLVDRATMLKWIQEYSPPSGALHSHTTERSFSSCFVSHSSSDSGFAQKFTARLRIEKVPVWYAPEDILPGEKIYDQVKKAIASFDRLLVVLSSESMKSNWVQTELASALAREHREGKRVLFPVSLAPIDVIRKWECIDPDSGIDIARELRSYHIPDFSNWSNPEQFERQIAKVIRGLRVDTLAVGNAAQSSGSRSGVGNDGAEEKLAEFQRCFEAAPLDTAFDILLEGEDLLGSIIGHERYKSLHVNFAYVHKALAEAGLARQAGQEDEADLKLQEAELLLEGVKTRVRGIRARK